MDRRSNDLLSPDFLESKIMKGHLVDALVLRGDEGRVSYEKLRGGATNLRSVDIRMGKPTALQYWIVNKIARQSEPSELKHLSS